MIRAFTFDFWGTLFRDVDGDRRHALRAARLAAAAGVSEAEASRVLEDAMAVFARHHIERQKTLDSAHAVRMAGEALGVEFDPETAAGLADYFSRVILEHPPAPIDGALDAVRAAAERLPAGLISDTGISPGASLAVLLERHGFTPHLRCLTFSDEVGVSKPRPEMFHRTAAALGVRAGELFHLGDLEPTDIAGVRALGGTAGLFAGVNRRHLESTAAEHVFTDWREFTRRIDEFCAG